MQSLLKAPGTKRLKPRYDGLLAGFAFNFNLRRYNKEGDVRLLIATDVAARGLHIQARGGIAY
jgi:hypothetical protein